MVPTLCWPFNPLTQAWVGGFSNLMDHIRTYMAGRKAPFRLEGLRAIFVTPEDDMDEEDKVCVLRNNFRCFKVRRFGILFSMSSVIVP